MDRDARSGSQAPVDAAVSHGLFYYLPLLAPMAAGAGIGALVNKALVDQYTAERFLPGIRLDPKAVIPSQSTVNAVCIVGALAIWLVVAWVLRKHASYLDALIREGVAFVPALLILLLAALDNANVIPALVLYSRYAVILAIAGFTAINVTFLTVARPLSATPHAGRKGAFAAVIACAGVYWITFTTMGFLQYDAMNIQYTDTADWQQMLYNTLHGRFLMSSAFPHMFFGEHVQFLHLLLLPLYVIWPSLKMLIAVKSLWLASAAIPVYLLAVRRLGSRGAGVCFAAAYLLYAPMQWTDLDIAYGAFRPETAAIPALLWAVYCYDAGRMWGLALAAFFAVAAKEEMALPIAMLGVLLLMRRRWGWGTAFALGGLAWFFVCVVWVIPHFRHGASHMVNYYDDFKALVGSAHPTLSDIFLAMLRHPLHALAVVLRPDKVDYLLLLLVPLAFRPLFSWRMLLVALPSFASTLLASRMQSYNIQWHYQIALVPILMSGAIYGVEFNLPVVMRVLKVFAKADETVRRRAAVAQLATLVLVSSLVGNVLFAKSPISILFYDSHMETFWKRLYVPNERTRLFFREVRLLVPEGASVSATSCVATYFANRQDDFDAPLGIGMVDYVVLDTLDRWYADKEPQITAALSAGRYGTIYNRDGFVVLKRGPGGAAGQP